jgi:hypothetical protein
MIDADAFLHDLNWTAARYYTSAMASVPNAQVPARFWADTRIRTLPYDRGMLYFATVDHALRKKSGGRESLDTLVLALLARQKAGAALANADWEEQLVQHLGPQAVADFRAFLDGAVPLPASDAFGPCFAAPPPACAAMSWALPPMFWPSPSASCAAWCPALPPRWRVCAMVTRLSIPCRRTASRANRPSN